MDLIGEGAYIYPVGRLDYDSEGLLLMMTDGDLAARLTHPRHEVDKVYEVIVLGMPDPKAMEKLRKGVFIDGRRTSPADVHAGTTVKGHKPTTLLTITLREGRNRQIRKMCRAVGLPVRDLRRDPDGADRPGPPETRPVARPDARRSQAAESQRLSEARPPAGTKGVIMTRSNREGFGRLSYLPSFRSRKRMKRIAIRVVPALVLLVAAYAWVAPLVSGQASPMPSTRNGEWPMYTADLRGSKYSPLDQINGTNFSKLEVAWRLKTDNFGPRPETKLEGTPIMVKGMLYATAGTRRAVIAVEPAHGRDQVDLQPGRGRARHALGAAPVVGPRPLLLDRRQGRRPRHLRDDRLPARVAQRQDRPAGRRLRHRRASSTSRSAS